MNDYTEYLVPYDDYIYMTEEELFDLIHANDNDLLREEEEVINMFDDFDLSFSPEDISNEDFDLIATEYYNENNDS